MNERADFIHNICLHPADDLPRLVFADWLDENGEPERAEFIRVQCELDKSRCQYAKPEDTAYTIYCNDTDCRHCELERRSAILLGSHSNAWAGAVAELHDPDEHEGEFRRGFVNEIHCKVDQFGGGECQRCRWRGVLETGPWSGVLETGPWSEDCRLCHGSGLIDGIAAKLFREHPIQRVRFTDREPTVTTMALYWIREGHRATLLTEIGEIGPFILMRDELPAVFFETGQDTVFFQKLEDAMDWASARAVAYARSLAFPQSATAPT